MVYVTGIMNPRGERDTTPTFSLTERELDVICSSRANTTPLMVEHAYDAGVSEVGMQRVGIVTTFWKAGDGVLWGLAHVDERLPMGPRAIRGLLTGKFRGFSLGVPYDGVRFAQKNEVLKLGLMEVSLVETPDHEGTVLVAIEGASRFAGWAAVEARVTQMHTLMARPLDESLLDYFVTRPDLWHGVASMCAHNLAAAQRRV
jgi:hypothetical protein